MLGQQRHGLAPKPTQNLIRRNTQCRRGGSHQLFDLFVGIAAEAGIGAGSKLGPKWLGGATSLRSTR
jgi:hypothetical protein